MAWFHERLSSDDMEIFMVEISMGYVSLPARINYGTMAFEAWHHILCSLFLLMRGLRLRCMDEGIADRVWLQRLVDAESSDDRDMPIQYDSDSDEYDSD